MFTNFVNLSSIFQAFDAFKAIGLNSPQTLLRNMTASDLIM